MISVYRSGVIRRSTSVRLRMYLRYSDSNLRRDLSARDSSARPDSRSRIDSSICLTPSIDRFSSSSSSPGPARTMPVMYGSSPSKNSSVCASLRKSRSPRRRQPLELPDVRRDTRPGSRANRGSSRPAESTVTSAQVPQPPRHVHDAIGRLSCRHRGIAGAALPPQTSRRTVALARTDRAARADCDSNRPSPDR